MFVPKQGVMSLIRFMSGPEIIEKYSIPAESVEEIFAMLQSVSGPGQAARYLESVVDHQLDKYFKNKLRLTCDDSESLLKEDLNMVDFGSEDQPLERIAVCLEKLAGVLMPRMETPQPAAVVMLTPAEAAKQMRRNVQTVMKWCRQGKLGTKCGRNWLIDPKEVDRYLRGVLLIKGHKAVAG